MGTKDVKVSQSTSSAKIESSASNAAAGPVVNAGPIIEEMNGKIDALTRLVVVQAKMLKALMQKQGEESFRNSTVEKNGEGNDMSDDKDYLARRRDTSAMGVSSELDQLINSTAVVVS